MTALSDLEYFLVVAEERSFTAAAARLGVSRSYVSRVIAGLEERLGVRVLQRTTRRVELTRAGALLFDEVAPLLAGLVQAQARVTEAAGLVRGPLRVSMPEGFGERYLTPVLLDFLRLHPEVSLTLDYSEHKVDLVGQRFDLAIRGGELAPSTLIARRLCPFHLALVAAPAYLARRGAPADVGDLARHACILYLGNPVPDRWHLLDGGAPVAVDVKGPVETSSSKAAVDAALAGLGIARQPDFLVAEHVRSGALVQVLPGAATEQALWLVQPDRAHVPVRQALLVEHLLTAARAWSWPLR